MLNTLSISETRNYFQHRVPGLKGTEHRGRAKCPLCSSDNLTAFSVDYQRGLWHCFRCGAGGDCITLEMQLSGASFREAKATVFSIIGRPLPFADETPAQKRRRIAAQAEADAVIAWRDKCYSLLKHEHHVALSTEQEALRQWRRADGHRRQVLEDLVWHYSKRALEVERARDAIERAPARDVVAVYRRLRKGGVYDRAA